MPDTHTHTRSGLDDTTHLGLHDVYSAAELAREAGATTAAVKELIAHAEIPTIDGSLVTLRDAADAVQAIRTGQLLPLVSSDRPPVVFGGALRQRAASDTQSRRLSALMSTGLHVSVVLLLMAISSIGLTTASDERAVELARLVFVAEPGRGGGGGGGGLRMPTPPPPAERAGTHTPRSPIPRRATVPLSSPPPPATLEHEPLPPVLAPLMASHADSRDVRGLLESTPRQLEIADSRGPGTQDGVGDGDGEGIGEGTGSGLGQGQGGGAGGGPYRAGSGVTPPRVAYEAEASYPERARRRGIEGDVLLEVIVLANGTVGDVRVLSGLGWGLDEEAVNAVRRWRFWPAERFGEPVDVMVEVAVEFALR